MNDPIDIGPFTLDRPLQSGGMGQVWHATHRAQNIPVAIKFLPPLQNMHSATLESRFLEEVQTIARLNHPHVIMVLDYGVLPDKLPTELLKPQSPWLAMELCSGGNLLHAEISSWAQARRILSEVLRALAYVHARGILHRDLKPANILLTTDVDLRPGIKLADFGLAMDLQNNAEEGQVFGTPHYMAPEQVSREQRIFQPATDLYSFGCLAWAILSGKPPFSGYGKNIKDVLSAQKHMNPPELMTRFSVPESLESWLLKLLRKSPLDRFLSAADALRNLPSEHAPLEVEGRNLLYPLLTSFQDDDPLNHETSPVSDFITHAYNDDIQSEYTLESSVEVLPITQDQSPVSWRDPFYYRPAQKLLGAGLGLFALRETPLVGREKEKDQLWRFLYHTIEDPAPKVVIVNGRAGYGKTALINWWTLRAKEVGVAKSLVLPENSDLNLHTRISQTINKINQGHDLEYDKLKSHLDTTLFDGQILSRSEREKLADYLFNPDGVDDTKNQNQITALALNIFSRSAPLFIVIDACDNTEEVLEEIEQINRTSFLGPTPLIWVLIPKDENSQTLLPNDWLQVTLEELNKNEMAALLDTYLPLHPVLQEKLIHACSGKPFLLQQYLQQFVDEDMLQASPQGFSLGNQNHFSIMETQENVWNHRLEHLQTTAPNQHEAIEIAAVLGVHFDEQLWLRICDVQEIPQINNVLAQLTRHGMLHYEEEHLLSFTHPLLRQSILGQAMKRGRLRRLHRLCAKELSLDNDQSPDFQETLLSHWMQAESWNEALNCLDTLIEKRFAHSRLNGMSTLLRQREFLVETLYIPKSHIRYGKTLTYKLELSRLQENNASVIKLSKILLPKVRTGPWRPLAFHVFSSLGLYRAQKHDLHKAEKYYREALCLCPDHEMTKGLMNFHLGDISYERNDLAKAREYYETAENILSRYNWIKRQGDCNYRLGDLAWLNNEPKKAERYWQNALQLYRKENNHRGESLIFNSWGELERMSGNYAVAENHYRKSLDLLRPIGASFNINIYKINLGLVLLAQQKFDKSIRILEEAGHFFQTYNRVYLSKSCKFAVLLSQSALNPKKAQLELIKETLDWFPKNNAVDKDILWVCKVASSLFYHEALHPLRTLLEGFIDEYQDLATPAIVPQ